MLDGVAVVGEVGQGGTGVDGEEALGRGELVVVEVEDVQFLEEGELDLVGDARDVVVGEVELDEVEALGEELDLFVGEVVAGEDQDLQLLRGDDLLVEEVVSGGVVLLPATGLFLFLFHIRMKYIITYPWPIYGCCP